MTHVRAASAVRKRRANKYSKAPVGKTYGSRTVISEESLSPRRDTLWLTRCSCGSEKWLIAARLLQGRQSRCVDCKVEAQRSALSTKTFPAYLLIEARHRAAKKNLPFELTPELVLAKAEAQQWQCAYTKQPLVLSAHVRGRTDGTTLSLDRIDSSKGYTEDNLQLVHKVINNMKSALSDTEFRRWCGLVK